MLIHLRPHKTTLFPVRSKTCRVIIVQLNGNGVHEIERKMREVSSGFANLVKPVTVRSNAKSDEPAQNCIANLLREHGIGPCSMNELNDRIKMTLKKTLIPRPDVCRALRDRQLL